MEDIIIEKLLRCRREHGFDTVYQALEYLLQEFENDLRQELEEEGISWAQFRNESETMAMADPEWAAELHRVRILMEDLKGKE